MNRSRQNSDSKNSTSSDSKINEGEKVLCYHGSLIYEAKCLKIRESEDSPDKMEYFIHYAGWSKKWEEWVGESRILKYTEENVRKQKSLKEQEGKGSKKPVGTPGRKSSTTEKDKDSGSSRPCSPAVSVKSNKSNQDTPSSKDDADPPPTTAEPVIKKRKTNSSSLGKEKDKENSKTKEKETKEVKENVKPEQEPKPTPTPTPRPEPKYKLRVDLPEVLARALNNDTHFILDQQFLTTVPATLNCKQVFDEYLASKENEIEIQYSGLTEFIKGLQAYIDEMLGVQLLYRFEKLQYKTIKESHPTTPVHTLYCPILILRLICNLEKALTPQMSLTPKGLKLIDTHLKDFLQYLVDNYDKYFNRNFYDAATPEYLRMTLK
uniref:Mortality factor 4-like protein 1 n=1 Tax=Cacopsylla melanoneura TaxID=428564 RepID=A0A8D8M3Y5_9HEMI